jgi:hypothetical protein
MAERKLIDDLLHTPNPKGGESDAVRKRIRKEGPQGNAEGQKGRKEKVVLVTATETGRSAMHVFVEGRYPCGKAAYFQMIPVGDFRKSKHLGVFDWGRKAIDA